MFKNLFTPIDIRNLISTNINNFYCAQYTQPELIHKVTTDAPNVIAAACGGGLTPPSIAVCIPNNAIVTTMEIMHQLHKTVFAVNPNLPLDLSKPQYNTHIINAQIRYHRYGCKKFILFII